jgi:hypothetical protein
MRILWLTAALDDLDASRPSPDFSQPIGAAGGLTVGTQEVTGAAVSVGG